MASAMEVQTLLNMQVSGAERAMAFGDGRDPALDWHLLHIRSSRNALSLTPAGASSWRVVLAPTSMRGILALRPASRADIP